LILYIFSISDMVIEIFRKNCFFKKIFVSCYGFLKRLDLGQITLFFCCCFFFYCWESSLLWTAQPSQCFRNIRGGVGVFSRCFEPLYLKNCWTYQNEHGSIRSCSAPFFWIYLVSCFLKQGNTAWHFWYKHTLLTYYRPATAFGNRKKNILEDLLSSVFSQFNTHPLSGDLKFYHLGIFQSLKLSILRIVSVSTVAITSHFDFENVS